MYGRLALIWRSSKPGMLVGLVLLSIAFLGAAGCATDGAGNARLNEETSSKVEAPGPNEPLEAKEPSISKLGDGREGFVITETSAMDENARSNFALAVAMLEEENYGQAIELLQEVVEQSPGVTAPYIDLAIAYQRIGDLEQAEGQLNTALNLVPDHPVACNEYGLLYRRTGRFAEARTIHEKSLASFPEYYPAHKNLAILCDLYLNDLSCALEHYEIYSKAKPDDEKVKLWIADLRARVAQD